MQQEIYIIRHAHVAYDTELGNKYKVPEYKEHLTPLGWAQSLELDYLLANSGLEFDKIVSSDYCRTIETITPFAIRKNIEIHKDKGLREIKVKGDSIDHIEKSKLDPHYKNEGSESWIEATTRFHSALQQIASDSKRPLLISHGMMIKAFAQIYFNQSISFTWPDAFKLVLESGKYVSLERVPSLIPENKTDKNFKNFYPTISLV